MSISLQKGQQISLAKDNGSPITKLYVGLGWDPAKGGLFGSRSIDLDASLIMFGGGREVDAVWFSHLRSNDGSIQHSGDNLTGRGSGDDEIITIELPNVSAQVDAMVVVINSYRGQSFERVANASCHLVDQSTTPHRDLGTMNLSQAKGNHTAMVMASIKRSGTLWEVTMIGQPGQGRTYKDLVPLAQQYS